MDRQVDESKVLQAVTRIFDQTAQPRAAIHSARRIEMTAFTGTFPNFSEQQQLLAAAREPVVVDAATEILNGVPDFISTAFGPPTERSTRVANTIVFAASYPDLFSRPYTPQRIVDAFADLARGYITLLSATFVHGVRPNEAVTCEEHEIKPFTSTDSSWFSAQVP